MALELKTHMHKNVKTSASWKKFLDKIQTKRSKNVCVNVDNATKSVSASDDGGDKRQASGR